MRSILLSLWFAALAVLSLPVHAQVSDSEAQAVAAGVLAHADWRQQKEGCAAGVMPAVGILPMDSRHSCSAGKLASCLQRCTAGNASSCYWLATAIEQTEAYEEAAHTLFYRACKLGVVSACTNHAAAFGLRNKRPDAGVCEAQTFAMACALDDPWACTMYGSRLFRGEDVAQSDALALQVLDKSCKYGEKDEACQYANKLRRQILGKTAR